MEWFTIIVTYLSVGLLLFLYPGLAHRRKKTFWPCKGVAVVAHRGGSGENPENTLMAFKEAKWCDILELDVQFTSDGLIVICHDEGLERLCGVNAKIEDFCYRELPRYSSSFCTHFIEEPVSFPEVGRFSLLEELLEECPNSVLCIDLKTQTLEAMMELTRLMKKYKRWHNTILGMNNLKLNQELHKMNPDTLQFMSMGRVIQIYLSYLIGFIGFLSITEDVLALPIMTSTFTSLKQKEMGHFRAKIYTSLVNFFNSISGPLFRHLQKRGIKVLYWTLNQESDFELALKKNCDGIITDYPKRLKSFLINTQK